MGSSPLLRHRTTALVLASGPVVTIVALWVTDTRVVPRFLSFLLVPLFILAATGVGIDRSSGKPGRPAFVRTAIALAALVDRDGWRSSRTVAAVVELPREAHKEAADAIREHGWDADASVRVCAAPARPRLLPRTRRRVAGLPAADSRRCVCSRTTPVVLVVQPWDVLPPRQFPCSDRPRRRRHLRFEQYARGDEIDVWFASRLAS